MKKLLTIIGLAAVAAVQTTNAAVLVGWDFSTLPGGSNNFGSSPYNPTTTASNITAVGLTRGSGLGTSGTGAANAWGGNDATETSFTAAVTGNDFVTFSLTANTGFTMSLSSIDAYNIRRSGTGPTTGQWQYAIGAGPFNDIGSAITWGTTTTAAGNPQSSIDLTGISALQNVTGGTTVTFRVVVWGGTSSAGTWYFNDPTDTTSNDLTISGTVIPEPSTWLLLGAGVTALVVFRRRKLNS